MRSINIFSISKLRSPAREMGPDWASLPFINRILYAEKDTEWTEKKISEIVDKNIRSWIAENNDADHEDELFFKDNTASKQDLIVTHNSVIYYMRQLSDAQKKSNRSLHIKINVLLILALILMIVSN